MAYLTIKQKRYVIGEIGDSALVLLEFYLLKSGTEGYLYKDSIVGEALGWTTSKVQRYRLELTKHKLFRQVEMKKGSDTMLQTIIGELWS